MGVEVALSLIQTLLTALQCSDQIKEFSSIFGYKPQLEQLSGTVSRIRAVLMDAETKQELSQEEKVYIEELKDALYEADDLFDEFLTLAQRKELTKSFKDRYFSVFKKPGFAFRMSQKVDKIQKKLDDIVYNNQLIRFEHANNFKHDPEPIKKRRPETCSYVRAVEIIGREADLEKIVGMLLQYDVEQDVSFLSIVGIGGLGKTALAQVVFNDPRVTTAFPLKLWACISDLGQGQLDIEAILRKILASISGDKNESATMDRVQNEIRAKLAGNRYLLVLDDVWTENREQWFRLSSYLMGGQRGSRILVTTRSKNTTRIMGDGSIHELQGLSEKDSWRLFEVIAFGSKQSNPPTELVEIGQEIVMQCSNIPLAIRVMGGLLYGQDKCEWLSIQKQGLKKMEENKNGIMPILKLSYQQLQYPLKSCFVYCAIFPKDYVMKRKTLMRLWMAQGYITPDEHRNMDDVAEEFFMVLLRRCFFQNIVKDEFGDIYSCKMHDLMHDVAQEIAGKEICLSDTIGGDMDKKTRHVHHTSSQPTKYTSNNSSVRSYLQGSKKLGTLNRGKHSLNTLLDKWKYLRVLCLSRLNVNSVSSSIGGLLHLRYIDFSYNVNLELLPKEITKLYNLRTIILGNCYSLKELPKDMSKLVNLRVLDIDDCLMLTCMPDDIGKLECLQELTMFLVSEADCTRDNYLRSLENLKALKGLKGFLKIQIIFWEKDRIVNKDGEGKYLQNKEYLNYVNLNFTRAAGERRVENDEALFEELQPHSNIKRVDMRDYQGVRTPQWWQEVNLANLVKLKFEYCPNLQCLGCVGNLQSLKHLYLYELKNLEFLIEKNTRGNCDALIGSRSSRALEFSLFPSLETLELHELPNLKGWWKNLGMEHNYQLFRLPQLTRLVLHHCPNLTPVMDCPTLKFQNVHNVNKKREVVIITEEKKDEEENGDERGKVWEHSACGTNHPLKLRKMITCNLKWLDSLQMDAFQCPQSLNIEFDSEVESLEESGELFSKCSSSLRSLTFYHCLKLRSVSRGLEHLTTLGTLTIRSCLELRLSEEEEKREEGSGMGMQWQSLNRSLHTLILWNLPQLVNLPNWIQNLTNLRTLEIRECIRLKSLPNWMSSLTSLQELRFIATSKAIKERCEHSTGEDWPHIKHISTIVIK